jgi:ABC-type bacteriocin/lantibiotic exporter with double-glycine peptidase domain
VLAANELLRTSTQLRSYAELLASSRRRELARQNGDAPGVPADVVAENVAFAYEPDEREVLSGVTFSWSRGEPLVLAGPNGSGKSTLLRLLIGLRPATHGALSVGGRSLADIDLVALRQHVAFLPQRPYLGEPSDSLRKVLTSARDSATDAELARVLERMGLSVSVDRLIGELSAGQRQRIALARVVLQDREIVLLDEPDANLDAAGVDMVERLVGDMVSGGKMVAVAAHTADFAKLGGCRVDLRAPRGEVGRSAPENVSKQTGDGSV